MIKRKLFKKTKKGFSLTELLITMAVIGILFVGYNTAVSASTANARVKSTKMTMELLSSDLISFVYTKDYGTLCESSPTIDIVKGSLVANAGMEIVSSEQQDTKYVFNLKTTDTFKRKLVLTYDTSDNSFKLFSNGPKTTTTEDDITLNIRPKAINGDIKVDTSYIGG